MDLHAVDDQNRTVLVMDASNVNSDTGEVEVVMGYENSPAKVIRHAEPNQARENGVPIQKKVRKVKYIASRYMNTNQYKKNVDVTKTKSTKKASSFDDQTLQRTVDDSIYPRAPVQKTSTPNRTLERIRVTADESHASDSSQTVTKSHPSSVPFSLSQMSFAQEISRIHEVSKADPFQAPKCEIEVKKSKSKSKQELADTRGDDAWSVARYWQYVYLETTAKEASHQQEEKTMSLLSALAEKVEDTRQQCFRLHRLIFKHSQAANLQKDIDLHRSGVEELLMPLDQFTHHHSILSSSLDAIRHELPSHGIHQLSPNDRDELHNVLRESESLLSQIEAATLPSSKLQATMAHTVSQLAGACANEKDLLQLSQRLLKQLAALVVQDSSLLIHGMECASMSRS